MSMFQSKADGKAPAEEVPIHRIRITLTSRNVKSLEKGMHVKYVMYRQLSQPLKLLLLL